MQVQSYFSGSCAVSGILDLGNHKNALAAMKAFCVKELAGAGRYVSSKASFPMLTPYYVFVAGPEVSGKDHSKNWVKYGTEFAAYIAENGLGDVATVGPKKNLRYHPDTTCQVWAWSPNQKAVEKWWTEHKNKDE